VVKVIFVALAFPAARPSPKKHPASATGSLRVANIEGSL
jgi:hypothetical protein